jgi:hypothetical protein
LDLDVGIVSDSQTDTKNAKCFKAGSHSAVNSLRTHVQSDTPTKCKSFSAFEVSP